MEERKQSDMRGNEGLEMEEGMVGEKRKGRKYRPG